MWNKCLNFKRCEYPNFCLLAELIITMSGSNSTVERTFNTLKNMATGKRLSLHHNTMQMLLQICLNDKLWKKGEREEILNIALEEYEAKRRATKLMEKRSFECQSETIDETKPESSDGETEVAITMTRIETITKNTKLCFSHLFYFYNGLILRFS